MQRHYGKKIITAILFYRIDKNPQRLGGKKWNNLIMNDHVLRGRKASRGIDWVQLYEKCWQPIKKRVN